jgi:endonuclease/exonuclease/phosphatase family metal-dependent hydrolase
MTTTAGRSGHDPDVDGREIGRMPQPAAYRFGLRGALKRAVRRTVAWTVIALSALWLVFIVLHRLFSGRTWLWVLPDLLPPLVYVAVPLVLLAATMLGALTGGRRTNDGRCRGGRWLMATSAITVVALALSVGEAGLNVRALTLADSGPVPRGTLHVMSWNTGYWDQSDSAQHFYRYLTARDADVYVLQEYLNRVNDTVRATDDLTRLRREFPGYHVAICNGLMTLSRFPIAAAVQLDGERTQLFRAAWRAQFGDQRMIGRVLRTDLSVGDRTLSVYNVHMPLQLGERRLLTEKFYLDVRARVEHRKTEFAALRRDVEGNDGPVLVAGDFNTTAAMGDLRWLRSRLDDAAHAGNTIYPASWPAAGPDARQHVPAGTPALWRLDWAFTSNARVLGYTVAGSEGMSDHRAQELRMALPGGLPIRDGQDPESSGRELQLVRVSDCAGDEVAGYR